MSPADEAMARYAQGDVSAFDAVYEGVAPRLERYLRRHQSGGATSVTGIKLGVHRAYVALRAALDEALRPPLALPRAPRSTPGGLLPAGGRR